MRARPKTLLSLLAIPVFCIALQASATPITNIVTNGGFETGDFTGWTQSGNTGFTFVDSGAPHSGTYSAFSGPTGSLGYISQSLSTVAGMTYELSFFLENFAGGEGIGPIIGGGPVVDQIFQVFWNGSLIFSIPPSASPSTFTQFNFTGLVATGATTDLTFGFRNDPSFWNIDDISAGISAVPEALSTIWLGVPVVGMFAFLQLRRKRA
jgi:hypothetical protein